MVIPSYPKIRYYVIILEFRYALFFFTIIIKKAQG